MSPKISITKEKINEMPICTYNGKIIVIASLEDMKVAIDHLKTEKILGFDTETKPSFTKGVSHKVSLIQIANSDTCYLFRLNKIGFPIELERLLKNKKITKIGLSLHDDFQALGKRKAFNPQSFIDLQKIVHEYGIADLSLQKIFAILFGEKISKSQRLSNWEAEELSPAQQHYAALDAWAPLHIYSKLQNMPTVSDKTIAQN